MFRNDPQEVARTFAHLLLPGGSYAGTFQRIVFAIYDPANGTPVLNAFLNTFRIPS